MTVTSLAIRSSGTDAGVVGFVFCCLFVLVLAWSVPLGFLSACAWAAGGALTLAVFGVVVLAHLRVRAIAMRGRDAALLWHAWTSFALVAGWTLVGFEPCRRTFTFLTFGTDWVGFLIGWPCAYLVTCGLGDWTSSDRRDLAARQHVPSEEETRGAIEIWVERYDLAELASALREVQAGLRDRPDYDTHFHVSACPVNPRQEPELTIYPCSSLKWLVIDDMKIAGNVACLESLADLLDAGSHSAENQLVVDRSLNFVSDESPNWLRFLVAA